MHLFLEDSCSAVQATRTQQVRGLLRCRIEIALSNQFKEVPLIYGYTVDEVVYVALCMPVSLTIGYVENMRGRL